MSILTNNVTYSTTATNVKIENSDLVVTLQDGRKISVPIHFFKKLQSSTSEQLSKCEILYGGKTLHWEELDEDISVPGLLGLREED
jgi:hypothetical protein